MRAQRLCHVRLQAEFTRKRGIFCPMLGARSCSPPRVFPLLCSIGSLGSLLMDSSGPAPTVKPDLKAIHAPATDLQVTWLGHATFLVQLGGINILTDPVFNEW